MTHNELKTTITNANLPEDLTQALSGYIDSVPEVTEDVVDNVALIFKAMANIEGAEAEMHKQEADLYRQIAEDTITDEAALNEKVDKLVAAQQDKISKLRKAVDTLLTQMNISTSA
jgi:hypothetical protein